MMKLRGPKPWLAIGALVLLTPLLSVAQQSHERKAVCGLRDDRRCQQVPDGGSAATYLLVAGAACLGAVLVRSRLGHANQS